MACRHVANRVWGSIWNMWEKAFVPKTKDLLRLDKLPVQVTHLEMWIAACHLWCQRMCTSCCYQDHSWVCCICPSTCILLLSACCMGYSTFQIFLCSKKACLCSWQTGQACNVPDQKVVLFRGLRPLLVSCNPGVPLSGSFFRPLDPANHDRIFPGQITARVARAMMPAGRGFEAAHCYLTTRANN